MKKVTLCLFLLTTSYFLLPAQNVRQLRKVMELKMPKGPGDNGGTVALNLKNRNYYATIAGNKTHSMAFFNGTGALAGPPDLSLLADIRGMWYNPALKTFQTNGYGTMGWLTYVMDDAGIPYDIRSQFKGQLQPHPNSVAAYNQKENVVYFLKGSTVVVYDAATGKPLPEKTVLLKTSYTKKAPPPAGYTVDSAKTLLSYNTTTVVFTGAANNEFGLLNIQTNEIELYSKTDGLMYTKYKLPETAVVKEKLNFAYCNNIYWLYDDLKRSWIGYR
jgi:hypothetical protein